MKFSALNLNDDLLKGINDAGFTKCMPVQEQTLVHTLKGKDVTVQSQTGTGKTAVFLITIFQHFLEKRDSDGEKKQAMIIAPTRELAVQIEKDAKLLGKYLDFSIGSFYGGVGYELQEKLLAEDVNIIVGTPGRLLDLGFKKLLDFNKIGFLVIDEADRLFDMGFLPDIRKILKKMPPREERQTMLFSATLDLDTTYLAYENMNDPISIEISPEQVTVDKITQVLYHVAKRERMNLLLGLLKKDVPKSALIFTNLKSDAARVAKTLEHNGYKCQHISGDLPQKKRLQIMDSFKAGNLPFLVATDVAARGLHIEDLELIVNYDLPGDCENYVHRIGRTARAGKSGKAISMACEECVFNLEAIENFIDMKIPVDYAEDELFEVVKGADMDFTPKRNKFANTRKHPVRSKPKSRSHNTPGHHDKSMDFERDKDNPARGPQKSSGSKDRPKGKPVSHSPAPVSSSHRHAAGEPGKGPVKGPGKGQGKGRENVNERKDSAPKRPDKTRTKGKQRTKAKLDGKQNGGTLEDRLEYYRRKYGDDFKVTSEPAGQKGRIENKSFFKKIASIFSKKKSV